MLTRTHWIGKAPASVRNQLFDHKLSSATAGYYLDQNLQIDTKACLLGKPSNEIVQKMARLASLDADANAPNELSKKQIAQLSTHPAVVRLSKKNKALTTKLRSQGYILMNTAKSLKLYDRKRKTQNRLNSLKVRLRNAMKEKARKRHFRKANTIAFDSQFFNRSAQKSFVSDKSTTPRGYDISERAEVVRWICQPVADLTDRDLLERRIKEIEAMAAMCRRQKIRRCRKLKSQIKQKESDTSSENFEDDMIDCSDDTVKDFFQLVCKKSQCIFCLDDERKPYEQRTFNYSRPSKMMDETNKHLRMFAPNDKIPCPHPMCRSAEMILLSVMTFKAHTAKVHKIFLRG